MQSDAHLRLPADTAYVAVLRMTTAGIAARLDFTLEDIEDLRIAVGEACALVLEDSDPEGELAATYTLDHGRMRVAVSATAGSDVAPDQQSFAWQVLNALGQELTSEVAEGRHTIAFTVTSGTAG